MFIRFLMIYLPIAFGLLLLYSRDRSFAKRKEKAWGFLGHTPTDATEIFFINSVAAALWPGRLCYWILWQICRLIVAICTGISWVLSKTFIPPAEQTKADIESALLKDVNLDPPQEIPPVVPPKPEPTIIPDQIILVSKAKTNGTIKKTIPRTTSKRIRKTI